MYTDGRALRFAFWTITFPAPSKRKPDSQRETPNYVAIRTRVAADQCHPMEETPPSSWEVSEEGTAVEEEIKTEEDQ